ncbi:O-acetyl-ADP-ribose deacetylase [Crassaminicella thermophila]|uniref:O-acetyl-ADP-ribose deacetylase n=1 Tax=Crassaminicella thermophila TaxID=2599308 RepID=A0A5C0SBH8_CRATE|nr:O-acetyl-ADP-ribose deacetylase [Crassaminicella thermophila]QEK11272.1 O-acetyl-ADP-ribose deacetylase [Crassaminicella thermophila]
MYTYRNTKMIILQGDITKLKVDAIVNAANNRLLGGGGVDGAIHKAGGIEILEQCRKIGGCPTGEARITTAGKMQSKYVIHTVGPIYRGGHNNEREFLYRAYYNSLKLAVDYDIKTIAFPSISTGAYGYPIEEASEIAIKAVMDFIDKNDKIIQIIFVLFKENDFKIYKRKLDEIL